MDSRALVSRDHLTISQLLSDSKSGIPTSTEAQEREQRKRDRKAKDKRNQPEVKHALEKVEP